MISSPCRTCKRIDQPKDECYKNCTLLQKIQIQLANQESTTAYGSDDSEEGRFSLHLSHVGVHPLFS